MPGFEKCPNCGAPLESSPDGRSVRCTYCGAGESRAVDPGRLVASLRAETHSLDQLFDSLAGRFANDLPELTRLETRGGFLSSRRVDAFEISFEGQLFRMKRGNGRIVAETSEIVRGIAVKTEVVAADAWLLALCEALSDHASSNAATLDALRRIGG
ncbi:MAG: hypothetical protein ACHQNV_00755 [Vicinamibacteria bacterium]